jgi:hypothetical protein
MAINMPVLSEIMPVEPVLVEIISRQSRITFFYEENLIDQIRVTVLSGQSSKYFPSGYDTVKTPTLLKTMFGLLLFECSTSSSPKTLFCLALGNSPVPTITDRHQSVGGG